MGLLVSIPHGWGSQAFTHYTSTFPSKRNHRSRASLLALRCPLWGKGHVGKLKLFFLPSAVCLLSVLELLS